MAEATLFVSSIRPDTEPTRRLPRPRAAGRRPGRARRARTRPTRWRRCPAARSRCSQWAAIVDPDTGAELPDEHVGEIWLHGDNIGRGYWARAEETEVHVRQQAAVPAGLTAATPTAPRPTRRGCAPATSACYIDGELYITGRIKDLVIVDGRNHYPQDIEATVAEASAGIRAGLRRGVLGAGAGAARRLPDGHQREAGHRRRTRAGAAGRTHSPSSTPSAGRCLASTPSTSTTCGSSPQASSRAPPAASWRDAHVARNTSTGR